MRSAPFEKPAPLMDGMCRGAETVESHAREGCRIEQPRLYLYATVHPGQHPLNLVQKLIRQVHAAKIKPLRLSQHLKLSLQLTRIEVA